VNYVAHHESVVELNRTGWKSLSVCEVTRLNGGDGQTANAPIKCAQKQAVQATAVARN
jgi:hypothetical protein